MTIRPVLFALLKARSIAKRVSGIATGIVEDLTTIIDPVEDARRLQELLTKAQSNLAASEESVNQAWKSLAEERRDHDKALREQERAAARALDAAKLDIASTMLSKAWFNLCQAPSSASSEEAALEERLSKLKMLAESMLLWQKNFTPRADGFAVLHRVFLPKTALPIKCSTFSIVIDLDSVTIETDKP